MNMNSDCVTRRCQRRNFCLKGGVPIQKENGPRGEKEGEWGESIPLLIRLQGLGEHRELSQRGQGGAPAENGFIVI